MSESVWSRAARDEGYAEYRSAKYDAYFAHESECPLHKRPKEECKAEWDAAWERAMASLPPSCPAAYCLDCSVPIYRQSGRAVKHAFDDDSVPFGELCDPCHEIRYKFGTPRKRTFQVVEARESHPMTNGEHDE